MAIPLVQITGKVLTPDGEAPSAGSLSIRLSQPGSAVDAATGKSERVISELRIALGADGSLPAGFDLVPNDAIVPSGTHYHVTYTLDTSVGRAKPVTEKWQLASSPNPIDIGAVPRLDVVPGVAIGLVPATATVTGGVRLASDLGGTATAPTVAATHLAAPLPEAQGGSGAATLGAGQVTPTGGAARSLADHLATPELEEWKPVKFKPLAGNASWRIHTGHAAAPNEDDQVFQIAYNWHPDPADPRLETTALLRDVPTLGAVAFQFESHWDQGETLQPVFEWNLDFGKPADGTWAGRYLMFHRDWSTGLARWKFDSRSTNDVWAFVIDENVTAGRPFYVADNPADILFAKVGIIGGGGASVRHLTIRDSTAQAAGVGGSIGLAGRFTDAGAYITKVAIEARKENSVSTDSAFALSFYTGPTGTVAVTERLRIGATGGVAIGHANTGAKLSVFTDQGTWAPTAWSDRVFVVGLSDVSGAASGGVFISYVQTDNTGIIGALSPGTAWRALKMIASSTVIADTSGNAKATFANASGRLTFDATDASGTPGAATINKPSGQVAIAAGASSVVVTNSLVTATSVVWAVVQATDATLLRVDRVVPAAGSFTVIGNANATGNTKVGFVVFN